MTRHEVELEMTPAAAAAEIAAAAEQHDGLWEATSASEGRLTLPVVYGLRHGVAVGRVELVRLGDTRTRLSWHEEESHLQIHRSGVAILSFAAIPLVITVAWPFYPPLFVLVPFAAVSGLLAWWLVVSRLRTSGPHEFFEALAESSRDGGESFGGGTDGDATV